MSWKPPVAPKPPFIADESQALINASAQLRRTITVIDRSISDLQVTAQATWWKGHDADVFRDRWHNERTRLEQLRVDVLRRIRAIEEAIIAERARARVQRGW